MTDTNRLRLSYAAEVTLGTSPVITVGGPGSNWATARITGETIGWNTSYVTSNEIRNDRNVVDSVPVGAQASGDVSFELCYGENLQFHRDMISAAFANIAENGGGLPFCMNTMTGTPSFLVNTDGFINIPTTVGGFTVGHLARIAGTINSNGVHKVVASSFGLIQISPAFAQTETPPLGATLQAVGIELDPTAAFTLNSDGTASISWTPGTSANNPYASSAGLVPGMWIKISSSKGFQNSACNTYMRIKQVVSDGLLICDNVPAGTSTSSAAGLYVWIYTADVFCNGTTRKSFSFEKAYLDMASPAYLEFAGMVPNQLQIMYSSRQIVKGTLSFMGTVHTAGTSTVGQPAPAGLSRPMNAAANVARLGIAGASLGGQNYAKSMTLTFNNNCRAKDAIAILGLWDIGLGDFAVSGSIACYFGDLSLYQQWVSNTSSSIASVTTRDNQAIVFHLPRLVFTDLKAPASGKNQDVMTTIQFTGTLDPTSGYTASVSFFPYVD